MSFVSCIIIFWLQIDLVEQEDIIEDFFDSPRKSNLFREGFIKNQKKKMKENISKIACLYAEARSQEISTNEIMIDASQVIVMLLYNFLGLLRKDENLNFI